MNHRNRHGKVNVKLAVILVLITTALVVSLVAARQVRRSILLKLSLETGEAAYDKGDWVVAAKNLQEYLGRNPDDVDILGKYAKARLSIRPLETANINGAISAYRRVLQLASLNDAEVAYEQLALLYAARRDFENLAYVARMRRDRTPADPNAPKNPNDWKTPLWLADALVGLNKTQEAREALEKFVRELKTLPDKHVEYVKACVRLSRLTAGPSAKADAEDLLNKAVAYDPNHPNSVEALVYRAQLYRQTKDMPGPDGRDKMTLAKEDLERAGTLGTDDPQIRYLLAYEWLAHDEFGRAAAELETIDHLSPEAIEESFFDRDSWKVARFCLEAELDVRRNALDEALSLADETLDSLAEKRYRLRVLPTAIEIYVAAGKAAKAETQPGEVVKKARQCLEEYLDIMRSQPQQGGSPQRLAWLQAIVEMAENKPIAAIDVLRPVAVRNSGDPEMERIWKLLADAYTRTDQSAQALEAELQYLRFHEREPQPQILRELAQLYFRRGNWKEAFERAKAAEAAGAKDLTTKLLRIEAAINLARGADGKAEAAKLPKLSEELDGLRQTQPKQVVVRVLQAELAGACGQSDEMEKQLKRAIEECDEPLRAQMRLARFYVTAKRIPDAVGVCTAACKRSPGFAEPWLLLSDIRWANADYEAARQTLTQGLETVIGPRGKRSLSTKLALLDLTYGDHATGIRLLKNLAAQDADNVEARSLLLETREVQSDPDAARQLIAQLQKAEGQSGIRWRFYQAALWWSSGDRSSKQQDITSLLQYCIEADPVWTKPALLLAAMYEWQGDVRCTEDTYRQALARNPSAPEVTSRLLAFLERHHRLADAELLLRQTQVDPRLATGWRAQIALGTGDLSRAADELRLKVSSDPQDASSRVNLAQLIYRQTKDSGQAFRYLQEAQAATSDSLVLASVAMVKATILQAEGQTGEAKQVLDDAVASRGDFAAYWMRAVYRAKGQEWEGAEQDYRKLTTFPKEGATGYELLAGFYATADQSAKAAAALEEGIKAYPEDLRLPRRLMRLQFLSAQTKDRDRAMELLTALEKQQPHDPELLLYRAEQMAVASTPESRHAAREKLQEVVRLQPTAIRAHLMLIDLAMRAGEYRAARDYAIGALGANAGNRVLLSARAKAELALGNTPAAVELARLVLQEGPNGRPEDINDLSAIQVLLDAGQTSNNRELFEEARTWIESAVRRTPALVPLAASILAASSSMELKKAGLKLFEQAAILSPESVEVRLGLASTLYQTGDAERAEKIYREVLGQYPNNVQALNDLAWILQERGQRYEEALALANKGLGLAPNDTNLLDTRGTILSKLSERLADARKDFEKLVASWPEGTRQRARALLQLGRVCAKLNDLTQANQHLQKALEIDRKMSVFTGEERSEIAQVLQPAGK
jgi:tetratricopeptide (TPR) repeat protein